MKAINLLSLLSAKFDLNDTSFKKYIEQFGMSSRIRSSELEDLKSLVQGMIPKVVRFEIFNHFYVGFLINRIGKEFDLLRIGEKSVVNIELKRESNEEKIARQLIQNKHYLKFLNVKIHNFTYISSTKKVFMLTASEQVEQVGMSVLVDKLTEQTVREIDDLDDVFDPANYLVSPFNSPEAFMEDKYFLTAQQNTFKREILNLVPTNQSSFILIKGGPGAGKTLLTYNIAKEFMRSSKKVLIFHCSRLNKGHTTLIQQYQWPIIPISHFNKSKNNDKFDFTKYDLIIFDEAQRLYKNKFYKLVELIKVLGIKCIFSLDPNQCLTTFEINNNIPKLIQEKLNPITYELTTIIRHNKEIHSFINKLFDLSRASEIEKFSNISIQYFSSKSATKNYLLYMRSEDWKIIDYTYSKYIEHPDNDHTANPRLNTQDVTGQEFDHVVAVIDRSFYYTANQKLSTKQEGKRPYFQPSKMLYQNISRTRKKLHIVIVNNTEVLEKILGILS